MGRPLSEHSREELIAIIEYLSSERQALLGYPVPEPERLRIMAGIAEIN